MLPILLLALGSTGAVLLGLLTTCTCHRMFPSKQKRAMDCTNELSLPLTPQEELEDGGTAAASEDSAETPLLNGTDLEQPPKPPLQEREDLGKEALDLEGGHDEDLHTEGPAEETP